MDDIRRVISRLEQQRAAIDRALSGLREVEGLKPAETARSRRLVASAQKPAVPKQARSQSTASAKAPQLTGTKTDYIRSLVEARGTAGATTQEIADVLAARHIDWKRKLIYNFVSRLVEQNKLKKTGDRYFPLAAASTAKSNAPQERRMSPQGLKNIIAANQKRAAKKATPVQAKKVPAKKAAAKSAA